MVKLGSLGKSATASAVLLTSKVTGAEAGAGRATADGVPGAAALASAKMHRARKICKPKPILPTTAAGARELRVGIATPRRYPCAGRRAGGYARNVPADEQCSSIGLLFVPV